MAVAREVMKMSMNQQPTGLEKDIEYIKTDIADMKTDIRRLNEKTDGIIASVSAVRVEMEKSHGALRVEIRDTATALRAEMSGGFAELKKDSAETKKELHRLHVGMLGMFITAGAGFLLFLARALDWL